jgi:hypothetical protein
MRTRVSLAALAVVFFAACGDLDPLTPDSAMSPELQGTELGMLNVASFHDLSADGCWQPFESPYYVPAIVNDEMRYTPFGLVLPVGRYTVTVPALPGGWLSLLDLRPPTTWACSSSPPVPLEVARSIEVDVVHGQPAHVLIGFYALRATTAKPLSFWAGHGGRELFSDYHMNSRLLWHVHKLDLRTADGSVFRPETYEELSAWLRRANAKNMAYMLSAQAAVTMLNVAAEYIEPPWLYVPGIFGPPMTVSALIDHVNTDLAMHPFTPGGHPRRAFQERRKDLLETVNSGVPLITGSPVM